jgi:hypothetical protein
LPDGVPVDGQVAEDFKIREQLEELGRLVWAQVPGALCPVRTFLVGVQVDNRQLLDHCAMQHSAVLGQFGPSSLVWPYAARRNAAGEPDFDLGSPFLAMAGLSSGSWRPVSLISK